MTPSHRTVRNIRCDSRWWFASFACMCTWAHYIWTFNGTTMLSLYVQVLWMPLLPLSISTNQTCVSKHHRRHLTARYTTIPSIRTAKVLKLVSKALGKSTFPNQMVLPEILQMSYNQKAKLNISKTDAIMSKRFSTKISFSLVAYRIWGTPNNKCEKSAVEPVVLRFTTGWTDLHCLLQRRTFGKWTR